MEIVETPVKHRPLQMIHGFDEWAGRTDDAIRAKIRTLRDAGLGGVVASVSSKNYLRDNAAWEVLKRGVAIAHEEGLRVWIYDEKGYPSGTAGGLVLEHVPAAEAQGLIRTVDPAGTVRFETIRLYEATHATENFHEKRPYINLLDPDAARTFLKVTHDRYASVLAPIDRYVEAFFTDEPSLIAVYIPKDRDYPQTLPWHPRLPEEFLARKGYDLLPHRESLFTNTGPIDRKIRCDFYEVVADLCAETYFGTLQQWCQRHGVASSGHLLGEELLTWQTYFNGDPFTCYRKFDIPGIDMITSDPEKIMAKEYFMVPKVAGSAARLQGKKRLMCEISDFFGVMDNRHASLDQMKCTAGILASFGVTDFCSYYALSFAPEGEVKPMEFSLADYRQYTDFTSRLHALCAGGTVASGVAVLYPMVSLWSHFTPSHRSMYEDHPDPEVRFQEQSFIDLCRSLLQQQIDFDIVDERSLAGAAVTGNTLAVADRQYAVLVLPPLDTLRLVTLEMVIRFADAGGSVFAHHPLPRYAAEGPEHDRRVAETFDRLCATGALRGCEEGAPPLGYLIGSRIPPRAVLSPASPGVLCTPFQAGREPATLFVNASSKEYTGTCTFRSEGEASLVDPATGETRSLKTEKAGNLGTRMSLNLRPFESLFVTWR